MTVIVKDKDGKILSIDDIKKKVIHLNEYYNNINQIRERINGKKIAR